MIQIVLWVVAGLAAYLLGAVPFGWLVARARGVDIRTVGSRNIGATNVFRCVGKSWGILTFLLDLAKGYVGARWVAVLAVRALGGGSEAGIGLSLACGCLTVVGHNWPVYLGFRGGKGVATSAGLLLGLAPMGCLLALATWVVVLLGTRYVSVASITAALVLAVAAWPLYLENTGILLPAVLDLLAVLTILRHRANIRRLLDGTESRFNFKRKPVDG